MAIGGLTSGRDRSRRDLSAPWRHVDVALVAATVALAVLGLLVVFSATRGPTAPYDVSFLVRQATFVALGVVAMVAVSVLDFRRVLDWAWVPYAIGIVGLLAVLSPLGSTIKGAQRWFAVGPLTLQPSEFTKLALVIALSALLAAWWGEVDVGRLLRLLAVSGVPILLVVLQPDLGTALQFMALALVLLVVGGVRLRYLAVLAGIGLLLGGLVLTSDTLADYQQDRLTSFIDPTSDTAGTTYNQNQSVTAVASGGVWGQGLFQGPQTQLRFVPEQETDFIFTVVTEELGFLGGLVVLVLYGVVCWRIWRIAQLSRDAFGTLLAAGVLGIFVFQVFANVGMAMGIMPVTGIPLPLLSYGGSSALTMLTGVGLVLSVGMRRYR